MWSNAEMDWDNEQICHWLTAVGLGEYVQVFRGMFVKLSSTGKESSAFGGFTFPFGSGSKQRLRTAVHHSYFSIFYITYHSEDKGRQFGLKIAQKKRNRGTNNRILYTVFLLSRWGA
jgi:hypothetical protein